MLVKTFQAASMAEALRLVKAELGPDAMILSTKKEQSGGFLGFFTKPVFKVTAAFDPNRKAQPQAPPPPAREQQEKEKSAKEELESSMMGPLIRELKELREKVESLTKKQEELVQPEAKPSETVVTAPVGESDTLNLKNIPKQDLEEIKKIILSTLMKNQGAGVKTVQWPTVSGGDVKQDGTEASPLQQELEKAGVSTESIEKIVTTINTLPVVSGHQTLKGRVGETIGKLIKFAGGPKIRKNSPRIIALVGPTGVGKTTTTAKLAAMYALNRGNKVALVTMDIFRVGAVEQLKTYSKIMGIPLDVASTPKELEKAIEKHSGCELIFVDTAGRSHKDREKLEEMKSYLEINPNIEVYLCLSATTKDKEIEEIVNRFRMFDIQKVVFTKIDESESCGCMLNLLIKEDLQVAYFTTGQRVPEDIEVATPAKFADMILREAA